MFELRIRVWYRIRFTISGEIMATTKTKMISYQSCLGIQNRKPTEDLKQPTTPYYAALARDELTYEAFKADNIDIDNAMMPSRRQGVDLLSSTVAHSLWSTQDRLTAYCISGNDLCKLNTDYSLSVILYGVGSAPMVFQEVPGLILYTNGRVNGFIQDNVAYPIPDTTQQFRIKLPAGQCMEYYRGRVYVGSGSVIWFSDAFRFFRLDGRRNFKQFPDEIDLMAATTDGIYVACGGITYFMEGVNPHKFELRPVAGYGAYRNTRRLISGEKIGNGGITEDVAIWTGEEGICCGMPAGKLLNITMEKYKMPSGLVATSLVVPDTPNGNYAQYITIIK